MEVKRWPIDGKFRSRTVACGDVIWTVANAIDTSATFEAQVVESLNVLESHLLEAGSARTHLLSIQVILADIANRGAFDVLWRGWIGADASHWPQRSCIQAVLAPGLLIELVAVAATMSRRSA